jgi:hypothetical protein
MLLVDGYGAFLEFTLGWAQPILEAVAHSLQAWTGMDLQLHPQWKAIVVAVGILVGAAASAWAEAKLPSLPAWLARGFAGAAGVLTGLTLAMFEPQLQPGEDFYTLWQVFGQSYFLIFTFAAAVMLAIAGSVFGRAKHSFVSEADAKLCWTVGERALSIYAGAAGFMVLGVGGKLLAF